MHSWARSQQSSGLNANRKQGYSVSLSAFDRKTSAFSLPLWVNQLPGTSISRQVTDTMLHQHPKYKDNLGWQVCQSVCVYISVCVCVFVGWLCMCLWVWVCGGVMCVCMWICVCFCACMCRVVVYVFVSVSLWGSYVCMYVSLCVFLCVRVYVFVCMSMCLVCESLPGPCPYCCWHLFFHQVQYQVIQSFFVNPPNHPLRSVSLVPLCEWEKA